MSEASAMWKRIGGAEDGGVWVGHDSSELFPVYTRGNAGEVYPEVFTPLSFSVASEPGERAMRTALLTSGLIRPEELEGIPITTAVGSGVFGGYAYLNLSIQRLAAARTPGGSATDADVNFLGAGDDPPPHIPLPNEKNLRATLAGLRYVWKTVNTKALPELTQDQLHVDKLLAEMVDCDDATDTELRENVLELMPSFAELFERHLIVSFAAGITVAVLTGICERQLDDPLLAVQLLAGLGDVDSAAPSQGLWDLSRAVNASQPLTAAFDAGIDDLAVRLRSVDDADAHADVVVFVQRFDEFLARFGSRGPNEWDTAFDTWETDPALALTLVDRMRGADESHNPSSQLKRVAAEAEALEEATRAKLSRLSRPIFTRVLDAARLYSRSRERTKTTVVRAIHGARLRSMELDRRLIERSGGQRGDLWYLVDEESDGYVDDPAAFASIIAERREQHRLLQERVPPFFFTGEQPPLEEWAHRDDTSEPLDQGAVLTGLPGCPGKARGRARVVTNPRDPRGLGPGDVLIAPLTDPSWTPLFVPAEAVVVDVGAVMSHAVIVSRELGIPCVVSAANATRCIPDGALIEVDGSAGTVTVIELPAT